MQEVVLLHITGEDRPGLTSALTGVLAVSVLRSQLQGAEDEQIERSL